MSKRSKQKFSGSKNIVAINSAGNFESTKGGNRNMVGWYPSSGSADSDVSYDLPLLRAQARDLVRNSPIGSGAISTSVVNSIGTGLKPQSRIIRSLLGWDDEAGMEKATAWQKKAEELFWVWADSKLCDSTKGQTFWEMQRLIFRSKLESGDCFVIRRFIERGGVLGLSLQVVEADRISNPNGIPDTNLLTGGVEKDGNGQPIAYHISNKNPYDYSVSVPTAWVRVPADSVIHVMDRLRPDQTRGIGLLAGVIEPLKQLQRLTEAELSASVLTSRLALAVTSDNGTSPIIAGMVPGAVSTSNGVSVSGSCNVAPGGTAVAKIGSAAILDLNKGDVVESLNPVRPNAAFAPFFEAIVRQIGVHCQIPYENLILYYSSSYTSARASQLDSKKTWDLNIDMMAYNFCSIVWGWFLEESIVRGYISAPGFFTNPMIRAAYSCVQWSGPSLGSLNPSVEADAKYKNLTMGLTTLQALCQENGSDWVENLEQMEREVAMRWKIATMPNPNSISSPIGPNGLVMNGGGTATSAPIDDDNNDGSEK